MVFHLEFLKEDRVLVGNGSRQDWHLFAEFKSLEKIIQGQKYHFDGI